jgi:hypothetical protein
VGAKWGHSWALVQQRAEGRPGVGARWLFIPWKPIVVIWLLLSAMLWCGYVGSALIERNNPFALTRSAEATLATRFARRFLTHTLTYPETTAEASARASSPQSPCCSEVQRCSKNFGLS